MIINCIRKYKKDCTIGEVYVNGKFFGYSLEDPGRPAGVKIPGDTCIPEGTYYVNLNFSPRFQRTMALIHNKHDGSVDKAGVRFTGIRVHGGNNAEHTAGCLLVAADTNHQDKVWGSLEEEFSAEVKAELDADGSVLLVISESV